MLDRKEQEAEQGAEKKAINICRVQIHDILLIGTSRYRLVNSKEEVDNITHKPVPALVKLT